MRLERALLTTVTYARRGEDVRTTEQHVGGDEEEHARHG